MTPEFRNALYYWQYNYYDVKKNASKSITFQLQQLFLMLQVSILSVTFYYFLIFIYVLVFFSM